MAHNYDLKTKPNIRKRILAHIIDYSFIYMYMFIMLLYFGQVDEDGAYTVTGLPALSIVLVWFLFTVGAEQYYGATIGNKSLGLRAAPKKDPRRELSIGQSFKRHLLDMVDSFGFLILGFLLIKNTQYNQRLGDLWAGSIVLDLHDPEQGLKDRAAVNANG